MYVHASFYAVFGFTPKAVCSRYINGLHIAAIITLTGTINHRNDKNINENCESEILDKIKSEVITSQLKSNRRNRKKN